MLELKDLHVFANGKEIIKGIDLRINPGEVHALMGPNASGKSTLAQSIIGNPKYEITKGEITLNGENILSLKPYEIARKGLFLSFQHPQEISGITISNFLRTSMNSLSDNVSSVLEFKKELKEKLDFLKIPNEFSNRYLNEGFSGGEKKKNEILQLLILRPKIAILDEPDSGLDIDSLKTVADGISSMLGPDFSLLLITHYQRILKYIKPDHVHILLDGKIVKSGGYELVDELEAKGYDHIINGE